MGRSTTRPTSTVDNSLNVVPSGSAHSVLADDQDSTSLESSLTASSNEDFKVKFGIPTMPTGATAKQVSVRLRVKAVGDVSGSHAVLGSIQLKAGFGLNVVKNKVIDWETTAAFRTNAQTVTNAITIATPSGIELDVTGIATIGGGSLALTLLDVFAAYLDFDYVARPQVSSVLVDGNDDGTAHASPPTIDDDSTPTIGWSTVLDADGGQVTQWQVHIFTAAQYGVGGFDAGTSTATASGSGSGGETEWESDTALTNATYRAYVRVAQLVNGNLTWSTWTYVQFVVDILLPALPVWSAVLAENAAGRIRLSVDTGAGGATGTDDKIVERGVQVAGVWVWTAIRTTLGSGLIDAPTSGLVRYDYEAPNGTTVKYRARAVHVFDSGTKSLSAWVESSTVSWSSADTWLKHPTQPNLNQTVMAMEYPPTDNEARVGVFQPLGRVDAVAIADPALGATTGQVALRVEGTAQADHINRQLQAVAPLLMQFPPVARIPDRWLSVAGVHAEQFVPTEFGGWIQQTLSWTAVGSPTGNLVVWQ